MPTNLVSGGNCYLSFAGDSGDYLTFMCFSEFTLEISADAIPKRTIGDGPWKKFAYSTLSYTLTFSGLMKFDSENWDWTQVVASQFNFNDLQFQVTYQDDANNIKSFRGYALVETSTLNQNPTDFVKTDFTLLGNGNLAYFDGTDPCPTSIDSISIDGANSFDGTINVTYTYSGAVASIQYSIDSGPFAQVTAGTTITVPAMDLGSHTIVLTPACSNSYTGTSLSQDFVITHELTCDFAVTDITISGTGPNVTAQVTFNDTPDDEMYLLYSLNGGALVNYHNLPIPNPVNLILGPLAIGNYTLVVQPVCGSQAFGTPMSKDFAVTVGASYSTIEFDYTVSGSASSLIVQRNGITVGSGTTSSTTGTFSASSTDTVTAVLSSTTTGRAGTLTVINTTTSTTVATHSYSGVGSASFSFSPVVGNDYQIVGLVTSSTRLFNTQYGTSSGICGGSSIVWISSAFADVQTGITIYTNSALTVALTGFTFIRSVAGEIFHLNSSTGVVGASSGIFC